MSTRRRHSAETKLKVVREALETDNAALVARRLLKPQRQVKRKPLAGWPRNEKLPHPISSGRLISSTST
jgi:hypothetical protein